MERIERIIYNQYIKRIPVEESLFKGIFYLYDKKTRYISFLAKISGEYIILNYDYTREMNIISSTNLASINELENLEDNFIFKVLDKQERDKIYKNQIKNTLKGANKNEGIPTID